MCNIINLSKYRIICLFVFITQQMGSARQLECGNHTQHMLTGSSGGMDHYELL